MAVQRGLASQSDLQQERFTPSQPASMGILVPSLFSAQVLFAAITRHSTAPFLSPLSPRALSQSAQQGTSGTKSTRPRRAPDWCAWQKGMRENAGVRRGSAVLAHVLLWADGGRWACTCWLLRQGCPAVRVVGLYCQCTARVAAT